MNRLCAMSCRHGKSYSVVSGLKEGVGTTALSESDLKKAYSNEIFILVHVWRR
jgi:hypothetical protein